MRRISRQRIRKAAEKILLLVGLLGLMTVPSSTQNLPGEEAPGNRVVLVSIPDRKLALLEHGNVVKIYRVAVGARISPSPTGEFEIVNRIKNPTYYHPHVVIPASAASPIGTRWIGISRNGYAIHGTNDPQSIGHAASHGCIRMRNGDVAELFSLVRVGDRVVIRARRDAISALVFGAGSEDLMPGETANQAGE